MTSLGQGIRGTRLSEPAIVIVEEPCGIGRIAVVRCRCEQLRNKQPNLTFISIGSFSIHGWAERALDQQLHLLL